MANEVTNPSNRQQLPPTLVKALRRPPGQVVAIVATVDEDGAPRTATIGALNTSPGETDADEIRRGPRRA